MHLFELSTLGKRDPSELEGHRLRRRQRIEADKALHATGGRSFSLVPLRFPEPDPALELGPDQAALLAAIRNSYETFRATRPLDQMIQANDDFMRTTEWKRRDWAVQRRDELFARETAFTELAARVWDMATGEANPELLAQMRATLVRIDPEALSSGMEAMLLVLSDAGLREQALDEVRALIAAPPREDDVPATESELLGELLPFHRNVLEQAGIDKIEEEFRVQQARFLQLEQEFQNAPDALVRSQVQERMAQVQTKMAAAHREKYATVIPERHAQRLVAGYDRLIRRRMRDIGPRGAFFAARLDALHAYVERRSAGLVSVWNVLDRQGELLAQLEEARPLPDPLAGLPLPRRSKEIEAFNKLNALIQAEAQAGRERVMRRAAKKRRERGR